MLKAKNNQVLDATGRQLAVVLPTNLTKKEARRWAQYIVDRVNADERGKAFSQQQSADHSPDAGNMVAVELADNQ